MTAREIITQLAQEQKVEKLINYKRKERDLAPSAELQDLAQMIYLSLLSRPAEQIERAYNEGWLDFRILAMINNLLLAKHSAFHDLFDKYTSRVEQLNEEINLLADEYFEKSRCERSDSTIQGGTAGV